MGTNLLAYASQSAPMPHVYSFCLISIFLFLTIKWFEGPTIKNSIIIGIITGAITLIRPSDIVIVIIFILFGLTQLKELRNRILFFKNNAGKLAIITIVAICVWIPQFIYWKTATGHYVFYSYIGERFFFDNPKIIDGLFSFRKGWFVYTPIMLLAVVGILMMRNKVRELRIPITIFIILNIYVIFSWWCWWYGGSFGQRTIIDCYGILAVPLASFVAFISQRKLLPKILFACVTSFLIFLNIFQTIQFENRILHWDGMTKKLYTKQFLKIKFIDDYDKYVSPPNYDDAFNGKR